MKKVDMIIEAKEIEVGEKKIEAVLIIGIEVEIEDQDHQDNTLPMMIGEEETEIEMVEEKNREEDLVQDPIDRVLAQILIIVDVKVEEVN